jgi:polyisoprenoid-binding protein YceI
MGHLFSRIAVTAGIAAALSLPAAVQLDDTDITKSTVEVTIDVNSVDTRQPDRDKDLKSPHFFDADKFPTITFKSKKVEKVSEGKLKVTGDLTIHGVTKEVVLDVDGPTAPVKDPWGNQRVGVSANSKITRQDFGITYGPGMIGDEITITIDAEMTAAKK